MTFRATVYRYGYYLVLVQRFITRPHVAAAAAIMVRDDHILFVRQTYGSRRIWHLPGGLVGRREDPSAAGIREAFEETHLTISDPRVLGTIETYRDWQRAIVTLVAGRAVGRVYIDRAEILEARWFPTDAPPVPTTPATHDALKLLK